MPAFRRAALAAGLVTGRDPDLGRRHNPPGSAQPRQVNAHSLDDLTRTVPGLDDDQDDDAADMPWQPRRNHAPPVR